MKRIASIQDISCLGRCSLTVALPVISAMGVECAILPTAVLSTHTLFSRFTCKDLSDQLLPIAGHWAEEQVRFDAIYTGYLADPRQCADVCRVFDILRGENTQLFVDPAMADNGKLYPAFEEDFPSEMAKVVARADVVMPNITEACLLTGIAYREHYDEAYIRQLLHGVAALGARCVVLTGVSFDPEQLGVMAYDAQTGAYFTCFNRRVPFHFHGTGDIFAATTVGGVMHGLTLEESLRLAVDYTLHCIELTVAEGKNAPWYGVEFERGIPMLIERLRER